MSLEATPAQALWKLVTALRQELDVDRAGVFTHDFGRGALDLITGVDAEGHPEYGTQSFRITRERSPLMDVARRERPYYFSNRLREEYPTGSWPPRMTAHAIVPIIAGDQLLGTLNVDNALTGEPLREEIIEPLSLYASLAALPLVALYQQQERERNEELRRHIMSEMLLAVTNGKVSLYDRSQMEREWPLLEDACPVQRVEDVPPWRDRVRAAGEAAGMSLERARDLELCAAEAATNALKHGAGGRATVAARGESVRVRVADSGGGIDPQSLPRATLMPGASTKASAGLGYTLMMEFADRVYLSTGKEGTDLIIEMCVEPPLNLPVGWADLI